MRIVVAEILRRAIDGIDSPDSVFDDLEACIPAHERALCRDIVYGTLRWYWRLDAYTQRLISRPLKRDDRDILFVILSALYQLEYQHAPAYAVVSETVAAVKASTKPWASRLVNAVLRRFLRESEQVRRSVIGTSAEFGFPNWLWSEIRDAHPIQWQVIMEAMNTRPPMVLRVNSTRCTRTEYLRWCQQHALVATASTRSPWGVVLGEWVSVSQLPGFHNGQVSVQDDGAQLAGLALDLSPHLLVLDVCAAPGGKATHILELEPTTKLVALDVDSTRARRIDDNLRRLGQDATVVIGDARFNDAWWDGERFDRILLDVPCSGTGVVRRHPDIKHRRRHSDIRQFCALQQQLLEAAWKLLRSNGKLVYVTCSILPVENEMQIAGFIAAHSDAREDELSPLFGEQRSLGRQLLPGVHNTDGFYYARVSRI